MIVVMNGAINVSGFFVARNRIKDCKHDPTTNQAANDDENKGEHQTHD